MKDNGKSVGLDLSKFSHVSRDKDSHTLKHYEGHEIKLAHKKLSKANQAALEDMAERSEAKRMAEGGKVEKEDKKSKTITGVRTTSASDGVGALNRVRTADPDRISQHGAVIKVNPDDEKNDKPKYGKIRSSATDDSKPDVYAEGGQVKPNPSEMTWGNVVSGVKAMVSGDPKPSSAPTPQGSTAPIRTKYGSSKYAEGGEVQGQQPQYYAEGDMVTEQPIPISLAADPNAMTLPVTNPIAEPQAPMPDVSGLPDVSNKGIDMATQPSSPQAKFDFYKKNYDYMSDADILKQIGKDQSKTDMGAAVRSQDTLKADGLLAQTAMQKQQMGIPLSPAEQAAVQGAQQQQPSPGALMPDPGVQAAAKTMTQGTNAGLNAGMGDMEGMMASGYKSQLAGINQAAEAQGQLGQQQAALLNKQALAQETAKSQYQDTYNKLESERQALMADVEAGHVDPNKYWTGDKSGNGGHSKIMTGIGMILAGFNPTAKPNAAMDFLKYQMDQNVQAQMKNLDSKQNLLASNLRQFGNLKDATEMTRIMQNDMVANQLSAAAATAQSPLAKAAALQAAGKLKMETAPMFQQFAMRRAMMNLSNGQGGGNPEAVGQMINYMRMTNPEMAKSMEARYVPGVGLASIPVSENVRTEIVGKQNFDRMAHEYIDFVKKNAGSLSPAKITQGAALAAELQSAYRQSINGGQYKEGEQSFIEKIIPADPTQFAGALRTLPKVQEVLHNSQAGYGQLRKAYGLPAPEASSAPQEPQFAMKGGVKYMKVPGGWKPTK